MGAAVYASSSDVSESWRPLEASESAVVPNLLTQASLLVRTKVATVDERIADGTLDAELVRLVVVDMVIRALRNPQGLRSETADEYSQTFAGATGERLYLTDDERNMLAPDRASTRQVVRGRTIRLHSAL